MIARRMEKPTDNMQVFETTVPKFIAQPINKDTAYWLGLTLLGAGTAAAVWSGVDIVSSHAQPEAKQRLTTETNLAASIELTGSCLLFLASREKSVYAKSPAEKPLETPMVVDAHAVTSLPAATEYSLPTKDGIIILEMTAAFQTQNHILPE